MFRGSESFSEETLESFKDTISKGWLTRQYFTRGKHDLVLPAWLLGQLGPDGEGQHGISGSVDLKNTDLRSYYALGSPRSEEEPVIDHKGGVIPSPDSYTIIFGTVINNRAYYSSEVGEVKVDYNEEGYPVVTVYWEVDNDTMVYDVFADRDEDGNEALSITVVRGFRNHPLLVTLCPMDQDGITDVSMIKYDNKSQVVELKNLPDIKINEVPIRVTALPISNGHAGRQVIEATHDSELVECPASLASWAAQFPVRANPIFTIVIDGNPPQYFPDMDDIEFDWEDLMEEIPEISTSSEEADYYYRASAIVLRLLVDTSDGIITVGPSVQEKLWLPAIPFQMRALDRLGFTELVKPILNKINGFVDTNGIAVKNGQWDSQGAIVLALTNHFYKSNDLKWIGEKYSTIKRIAEWVIRQRKRQEGEDKQTPIEIDGLIQPGVASWFDPLYWKRDYFYSHNFWAASILDNAADLAESLGRHGDFEKFDPELEKFKQNIDDSITHVTENFRFLPAGPYQRDNAQMLFNLYAFYPLRLYLPAFQVIRNTLEWLWENYVHEGGVLIDQPFNAYGSYLSILVAQAWRYVGDHDKVKQVIDFMLSNVTNRSGWAEGISPLTRKGAVGDSPNGIAAAEWVNLILDLFAEDFRNQPTVLLKGMPIKWLKEGVEAKNLQLFNNSTLDISAKLEGNTFIVDWDYQAEDEERFPILFVPAPVKTVPSNVVQIATRELRLTENNGHLELDLDLP